MFVVLPNQLYESLDNILLSKQKDVYIIEDPIYFYDEIRPFKYNKIKLAYMEACMRFYFDYLVAKLNNVKVHYIVFNKANAWHNNVAKKNKHEPIHMYIPTDKDIENKYGENVVWYETPNFVMTRDDLDTYHKMAKHNTVMCIFSSM